MNRVILIAKVCIKRKEEEKNPPAKSKLLFSKYQCRIDRLAGGLNKY